MEKNNKFGPFILKDYLNGFRLSVCFSFLSLKKIILAMLKTESRISPVLGKSSTIKL